MAESDPSAAVTAPQHGGSGRDSAQVPHAATTRVANGRSIIRMNEFSDRAAPIDMLFARAASNETTSARTLRRDVSAGYLQRVRSGVFVNGRQWSEASDRQLALARLSAVVGTRRDRVVLGHEAAALIWGLPRIGRWPQHVDLVDARGTAPRSRNGVAWHRTPFDPDEVVEIDGFNVTGLEQTLVDLATTRSFVNAVVALDAALGPTVRHDGAGVIRGVERASLTQRVADLGRRHGVRGAREAVGFADERVESVGESLSRAQMWVLRFPQPQLQVEFDRADGGVDRVDFDWPDFELFGEFDGDFKYLAPRYRRGRTIEQVLLDEKKRADAICRRHRRRCARWDWNIALSAPRLTAALRESGLPQGRRRAIEVTRD